MDKKTLSQANQLAAEIALHDAEINAMERKVASQKPPFKDEKPKKAVQLYFGEHTFTPNISYISQEQIDKIADGVYAGLIKAMKDNRDELQRQLNKL